MQLNECANLKYSTAPRHCKDGVGRRFHLHLSDTKVGFRGIVSEASFSFLMKNKTSYFVRGTLENTTLSRLRECG